MEAKRPRRVALSRVESNENASPQKPVSDEPVSAFMRQGEDRAAGTKYRKGILRKDLPHMPAVSIVTTTFNRIGYLKQAIQSVLSKPSRISNFWSVTMRARRDEAALRELP